MKLPHSLFGINTKEAYERHLAEAGKKNEQPQEHKIITKTNIQNPEAYLILEGKPHQSYSYPDTLVEMERSHHGKNWFQVHEELNKEQAHMLTIRQYIDFLNILRSGKVFDGKGNKIQKQKLDNILEDILTVRQPWRGEWLNADFKVQGKELHILYTHRIINGKLQPQYTEQLDPATLRENKTPGISLDDWLNNATYQGLPPTKIKKGDLYYWAPLSDNNSVAWFGAGSSGVDLDCGGGLSTRTPGSGYVVRVRKNKTVDLI